MNDLKVSDFLNIVAGFGLKCFVCFRFNYVLTPLNDWMLSVQQLECTSFNVVFKKTPP